MAKPVRLKFMPSLRYWIPWRLRRARDALAGGDRGGIARDVHFKPLRRISVYCFGAVRNRKRSSRVPIGMQTWRQVHMSFAQGGKLTCAALLAANFAFLGLTANANAQSRSSVIVTPSVVKLETDIPALMKQADVPGMSMALIRNG